MLCSYCQINEAVYTLKNGKQCCQSSYQACPSIKLKIGKKITDQLIKQYANGTRKSYFKKLNDGLIWKGRHHKSETKEKLSKSILGRKMSNSFSENRSIEMKNRYANGWESKAGRTKKITYVSQIAGIIKVDGSWELAVAKFFDANEINWIRNTKRFEYVDSIGKIRTYCPDFYLIDSETYIEVKGYCTALDKIKWHQFTEKLQIWDKRVLIEKNIIWKSGRVV